MKKYVVQELVINSFISYDVILFSDQAKDKWNDDGGFSVN